jgi:hypothetical protein
VASISRPERNLEESLLLPTMTAHPENLFRLIFSPRGVISRAQYLGFGFVLLVIKYMIDQRLIQSFWGITGIQPIIWR